ncbi:polysaccharide pyruvyl transferase family protein [Desertihabitans brevis]|nr:polysaccharide pyruvyl transferase family protein [Desertihabitans brevis]
MRVGLVGYFGWGNFGDELMFQLWRQRLGGSVDAHRVHDLLHRPYFQASARDAAAPLDAIVIGGGDLIHPDSISPLYWNRAWLDKPVFVSGVGVAFERGGFRQDVPGRLTDFLGHPAVRSIGLRDAASAEWVGAQLGSDRVRQSPDLAFAFELPPPLPRHRVVGIALRKRPSEDDRDTVARVVRWARERGLGTELLVLATGHTAQDELSHLSPAFPGVSVRSVGSVDEQCQAISSYAVLFSAKFHGSVVALRYGTPTVSLRETHKIQGLRAQLGAHAAPAFSAELLDRDAEVLRPGRLPALTALEAAAEEEVAHVSSLVGSVGAAAPRA